MRVWLGALAVTAAACAHGRGTAVEPHWLEPRLEAMKLPASAEKERAQYAEAIRRGFSQLSRFAEEHGWAEAARVPTFDGIELYDDQAAMWQRVLELNRAPPDTPLLTAGLAAGVEGGVLLALTTGEYARVAPAYAALPDAWAHLVAHELAHRLHVNVLHGDEEAMGPQWFFEGFATLAGGQDFDLASEIKYSSPAEALAGAHDKASPHAYARFAAAVRYFAGKVGLAELVQRAGRADFEQWLTTLG